METLLIEFINTLEHSLKNIQEQSGLSAGFSRLTISQAQYLDAIHTLGQPTITELATHLNFAKASVTTGINKLVALGYVLKNQSNEDKRVVRVQLTSAGEELVNAKFHALQEYVAFIGSALTEEENIQFQAILAKLVRLFKQ
ncbi:MAG: MarR family transcriptional regulator [Anaerolineales bacterium]|nr:MarR family transcriptional regulator [Anaerolineales bacterium]